MITIIRMVFQLFFSKKGISAEAPKGLEKAAWRTLRPVIWVAVLVFFLGLETLGILGDDIKNIFTTVEDAVVSTSAASRGTPQNEKEEVKDGDDARKGT